jgi:sulfur relay (sulfurtransferase) DsrF/TusC family protein
MTLKPNDPWGSFMTIGQLTAYLAELPQDLDVRTLLIEDNTFTVLVSPNGDARTIRNAEKDHRILIVSLPERQG